MVNHLTQCGVPQRLMSKLITKLCQEVIRLKRQHGSKILVQKLQQKIDDIERHAADTQVTRKKD